MSTIPNGNYITNEVKDKKSCHMYDDLLSNPYNSDIINLAIGGLGPGILKRCIPIFEEATKHRMIKEKENAYLFQFGPVQGNWDYRDQLAKFLTKNYGEKVNRQDLILTAGATMGLTLILNTLLPPDGIIFIEEVSFMLYFPVYKTYSSMKLVPVPMSEEGIDTEAFEKIVANEKSKRSWNLTEEKPFWAMFYIIPIIHNPTGITSSEKCCKEIVRIARKMNILVLAEDIHNLLYYGKEKYPPRRLFSYDRYSEGFTGGNVISSATFSKILAPGCRLGWIEAPPRIVKILTSVGVLKSMGSVNHYMSGIITSIFELGLMDDHKNMLVNTLKDSMFAVFKALDEHLPSYCAYRKPDGGYFLWVKLPEFVNAEKFVPWCVDKYKVDIFPGGWFSIEGKFMNFIRISTGFQETPILKEAIKNLCYAIAEYVENKLYL